jgi:DNA recombination protein RmuC
MNALMLLTGFFALAAAGSAAWAVVERGRAARAEERARALEADARMLEERARLVEASALTLSQTLKAQAAQSAEAVADALVKRASETFEAQERLAQAKLEAQLKPVAESLAKFQEQAAAAEKARAEETGGLKSQVAALMTATSAVQDETRKLAGALRRGAGVQGRWGEQTLRNVLEAAGLSRRFDFEEQFSLDTEEGRRRPDVKVRLPGGAAFVIDAKCSLNAFLEAQDAPDDAARDAAMLRHAQSVRAHIAGLSAKAYWDQFKAQGSPDFVAMFVPGDGFLAAALDQAPELMAEAMDRRVLVVTPTTLFALCKAVAYGWRVEEQAKNADAVAALGRELYKRIAVMGAHALRLGRSLDDSVKRYNEFAGSLETQVLTQARRFEDLSVDHEGREIPELAALDTAVRALTKLAAAGRSDEGSVLTLESAAPTSAA